MATTRPEAKQVAIYEGGGYVYPKQKPGARRLTVKIEQAHLYLLVASEGLEDPLGPAGAAGNVTLRRDDRAVQQTLRTLGLQITERLGYPRFVRAE